MPAHPLVLGVLVALLAAPLAASPAAPAPPAAAAGTAAPRGGAADSGADRGGVDRGMVNRGAAGRTWHRGECRSDRGVTVAIDFRSLGHRKIVRCVARRVGPGFTGQDALRAADIRVRGVDSFGRAFVCRLQRLPTVRMDLKPGPGTYHERCTRVPPTTAYWSYWSARDGGRWRYSTVGYSRPVVPGGFEGWSFHVGRRSAKPPRWTPDRPGRFSDVAGEATSTVTVTADRAWLLPGRRVGVTVSDLAPGTMTTLRLGADELAAGLRADTEGTMRTTVRLPRDTAAGARSLVARTSDGRRGSVPLQVTSAARLDVAAGRDELVAGGTLRLRVSGLAAGEPYSVRAGGRTWSDAGAVADRRGTAAVTLAVPRSWQGRVGLRAVGAVAARSGRTHVTVVRPDRAGDSAPDDATAAAGGGPRPAGPALRAARQAVGWLIGDLRAGRLPGPGGRTDWGLTIDALWAVHAAGAGSTSADRIVRALAGGVDEYIGARGYGDRRARVAGATAKVLLAAAVTGRDPARFGGYDLRAEVLGLMQGPGGQRPGRFSDVRTGFDSSNTISQATAVLGLALTGGVPAPAVRFLRQQQCPAGGFRMYADRGRSCAQGPAGARAPDVDGTAMAVQALLAARADGARRLGSPIGRAVGWLAAQQERDGSFAGGQFTVGSNANSTGLAGQALRAGGRTAAAAEATRWLRSLQLRRQSVRGTPAGGEAGAVAYDRSAYEAARSGGIDAGLRDQWRRATAQAVLGLARVSFLGLGDGGLARDPRLPTGTATAPAGLDPADAPVSGSPADEPGGGSTAADRGSATTSAPTGAPAGVRGHAARALAGYLLGRLSDGEHVEVRRGGRTYVDHAATADVALALAQLGADQRLLAGPSDYLATRPAVRAYVHGAPYDRPGSFYADAAADLVLLGALRGDVDDALVAALVASLDEQGWAASTGRLAGPHHSVGTQAVTVLALTAAGARAAARDAVGALRAAQCDDGSFPRSAGAPCADGDVGATGWALQALAAVPAGSPHHQAVGGPAGQPAGETAGATGGDTGGGTSAVSRHGIGGRRPGQARAAVDVLIATRADDGLWRDGRGVADVVASGAADAGLRAVGRADSAAATSLTRLQADDGGFAGLAGTSDLTASAAAAPTIAGTSLLTMPGSVLGSGLTVPAAAPAELAPATASASESTSESTSESSSETAPPSTGTDAGQVPGWLLLVLGGLLAAAGATAVGWRLRRRPGVTP